MKNKNKAPSPVWEAEKTIETLAAILGQPGTDKLLAVFLAGVVTGRKCGPAA